MSADHRKPSATVGRAERQGGTVSYGLVVSGEEVALSAHCPYDDRGRLMIASYNERGDYRPIKLDPAGATALRDACNLYLADHPLPSQES